MAEEKLHTWKASAAQSVFFHRVVSVYSRLFGSTSTPAIFHTHFFWGEIFDTTLGIFLQVCETRLQNFYTHFYKKVLGKKLEVLGF